MSEADEYCEADDCPLEGCNGCMVPMDDASDKLVCSECGWQPAGDAQEAF